ncbi:hypothetical protein CDAR_411291 [Caerostris darwini]|uniref:Uncharacterized protein n=1 Tax=Caerostris darwini TaxID=1538125 RepID=A0AAV4SEB4_9ARAC|nr:hypothetical protein CDAR_411291 [Caerostris darwini]
MPIQSGPQEHLGWLPLVYIKTFDLIRSVQGSAEDPEKLRPRPEVLSPAVGHPGGEDRQGRLSCRGSRERESKAILKIIFIAVTH